MTEPNPDIPPVRFFIGGEQPTFETLADLREGMSEVDSGIVGLLAVRAEYVRQAALFKQNTGESTAPSQQAANIRKARERAETLGSSLPGFADIVEKVYTVMVPAYVEAQHQVLDQTVLHTDGHPMEPEIWDLGDDPSYRQRIIDLWNRKTTL